MSLVDFQGPPDLFPFLPSASLGIGLLSTAMDYARFLQMILNKGELEGHRILGRKTVELMGVKHLGTITFLPGSSFGLGFAVLEDLGERGKLGSVGELGWGGAYHSVYWIDPVEDMVVVHLTQLIPAGDVDDHDMVRALVYQAIADEDRDRRSRPRSVAPARVRTGRDRTTQARIVRRQRQEGIPPNCGHYHGVRGT